MYETLIKHTTAIYVGKKNRFDRHGSQNRLASLGYSSLTKVKIMLLLLYV